MHSTDFRVDSLANPPVIRVPLGRRPELDHVAYFAQVELEKVRVSVREIDYVLRLQGHRLGYLLVGIFRTVHDLHEIPVEAGVNDFLWQIITVPCGKQLPLDSQDPVSVQVAEHSIVREKFKSVLHHFKGSAGSVAAVRPMLSIGTDDFSSIL